MTNIKIVERVVKELPTERPLIPGEKYKVLQENGDLLNYTVDSSGEPIFIRGISNDQNVRLERLNFNQITKLEGLQTQEELDERFSTIVAGEKGSIGITDPVPDEDGIYRAKEAGVYDSLGGLDVPEGMSVWFERKDGVWSIYSEIDAAAATGVVEENNTGAVSGDETFNKTLVKQKVSFGGQLFSVSTVVNNQYINGDGDITNATGTSYGVLEGLDYSKGQVTLFWPNLGGNPRRAQFQDFAGNDVGTVINTGIGGVDTYTFDIPSENAKRLLFTIDVQGQTGVVDKNLITANYGADIVEGPTKVFVSKVDDKPIQAGSLEVNRDNERVIQDLGTIKKQALPKNLFNPAEVHPNSSVSTAGTISYPSSAGYHASSPMYIDGPGDYSFNSNVGNTAPVRSWRGVGIVEGEERIIYNENTPIEIRNITITDPEIIAVIAVFYNTVPADGLSFMRGHNSEYEPYTTEDSYEYVAPEYGGAFSDNAVITKKDLDTYGVGDTEEFDLRTTDKVLYTGSSSVESFYSPDRKSFVNKLQDFLDILIVPYGWSGNNANQIAQKLQTDTPAQVLNGVRPSEVNPTYVFVGQTLNSADMLDDEYDTAWIQSNENLLKSALAVTGARPILGTAYRTESRPWIENSLKRIADRWGADFMPFGTITSTFIRNNRYSGFYGNGHPAIRTMESYTLPLLNYMEKLPRPKKSILVFEARDQGALPSSLVYQDNYQRAEKFRAIQVGEVALDQEDQEMYDRLNETGYGISKVNTSEYMVLFRKQPVQLGSKVLVEVIVPKVRANEISIDIQSTGVVNRYLYNNHTKLFESVGSLDVSNRAFVELDKVKILLEGSDISISDIQVKVRGGVSKPEMPNDRIEPVKAGVQVIDSSGFDVNTLPSWNIGDNTTYNSIERYGSNVFDDNPIYLGPNKSIVVLDKDPISRIFSLPEVKTFGYRKARIWVTSRINPKIYNPVAFAEWSGPLENPYTDESWYGDSKYDYDDLQIILKYVNSSVGDEAKSVNVMKVGLFWNINYVDILLPMTRNGDYELVVERSSNNNDYPMEIFDISVELVD